MATTKAQKIKSQETGVYVHEFSDSVSMTLAAIILPLQI